MKVIKSGKDNESFGKELTCKGYGVGKGSAGCGAVLLVKPADVESSYGVYMGEGETSYWFVCPECGVSTSVKENTFKGM